MIRRLAFFLIVSVAAASAAAQQVHPVTWRASFSPASVGPGDAAVIRVDASIDPGWHLYSATQPSGGPMATAVELLESPPLKKNGQLRQSKFEKKVDPVFEISVEAFANAASFELPVRVDRNGSPGSHDARVRVRYQVCSARICLMPAERVLAVKLTVEQAPERQSKSSTTASTIARASTEKRAETKSEPIAQVAKESEECSLQSGLAGFYTETARLFWSDPDQHRRRIHCVPKLLKNAAPKADDLYFAGILWLRYDRDDPSETHLEKAATLLSSYLALPQPLTFEESALGNLVSTLARLKRFDEATTRYRELMSRYRRRSGSHEQWGDTTNVAWAGSALIRSLADEKRFADLEPIAREHLVYLQERESAMAWSVAAEASWLLRSLEEQGKAEAAAVYFGELSRYFQQHGEKYPSAAQFWLTTRRVEELEAKTPGAALAALEGLREAYRKAGFERIYDNTLTRLKLYDAPAPPLDAEVWLNSQHLSLQELRGRVILLDFWASWCGPCRKDFPSLEELSKKAAADGLVVISVTQNDGWFMTADGKTLGRGEGNRLKWDQEVALLRQFVQDFKMTMPVAVGRRPEETQNPFASSTILDSYGVHVFPTTILIDRNGLIRYRGEREGKKYQETLERLLEERAAG